MTIGIDISQMAYENTGVANFTKNLVENLLKIDKKNQYVLFYSSLRRNFQLPVLKFQSSSKVFIKKFKLPPILLDLFWNRLHILPIEMFLGDLDIFISSDWTQPPTRKAKKATIIYDLSMYKYPEESGELITHTHKRRLDWVKKECDIIFCISESTKQDAMEILGIAEKRLRVIYPGIE